LQSDSIVDEKEQEKKENEEFTVLKEKNNFSSIPLSERKKKVSLNWYTMCLGIMVILDELLREYFIF